MQRPLKVITIHTQFESYLAAIKWKQLTVPLSAATTPKSLILKSAETVLPKQSNQQQTWGECHGAGSALTIAEIAQSNPRPVLVLVESNDQALTLKAELLFFLSSTALSVHVLPDWEILAYDSFSAHPDIVSERIHALNTLNTLQQGVILVPITTLIHKLAPKDYITGNSFLLNAGQDLSLESFRAQLHNAGYQLTETVYQPGEYAVRGSLVDLFPMGSDMPLRVELFDEEVESLRFFNPETQRTTEIIDAFNLLPAREYPLTKEAISHFRQNFSNQFNTEVKHCHVYQDVSQGLAPAGIEYFIPLFFAQPMSTLLDYLADNTLIVRVGDINSAVTNYWQDIRQRYEEYRHDIEHPILPPSELFIPMEALFSLLNQYLTIHIKTQTVDTPRASKGQQNIGFAPLPDIAINSQSKQPLMAFQAATSSVKTLICAETAGRKEALLDLLSKQQIKPTNLENWRDFLDTDSLLGICIAPIDRGFYQPFLNLLLLSETQFFGQKVLQRRRRDQQTSQSDMAIRDLAELTIGSPVVHQDHGVGRYLGLQTLTMHDQSAEFLVLSYTDDAKLYVPVANIQLLNRYIGDSDHAPLYRLGSEKWQKAKRKAAEKIRDTATELLQIYSLRAARDGFAFPRPDNSYDAFAATFPFEETPDQQQTIDAVIKDMLADQPMDRLICGDVGFGKTEVAMRAAFIAVQGGKQVAVLVPTTLLAQQHYETLRDRFADWPVNIAVMSRFQSSSENSATEKALANGNMDIVVGTHKLIQGAIEFKQLGLLIIDEEHRFGVQQKETFKKFRADVDILTMTATPIPRTLNMSMSGMRDLSIIATPPAKRISIKTFVREYQTKLVKESLTRELARGGQVYYLLNDVSKIEAAAEKVRQLVPEARIAVAHGQMRERQLEQVMSDFYHRRVNVLVCTTIIETGIDIPNANTIVIERADKFGLAQLHQLRGRVGRSHHQAYAYLLTPHPKTLRKDAKKRLDAIEATSELGAGFNLASHDLEIRGAGELLGEEQSGQIHTIGFSLYMDMLNVTIESMKKGEVPNLDNPTQQGAEVNLNIPALIPDDYLPDVHNRLVMYQRIANASSATALKELQVEMIDRFGLLTEPTRNLFRQTKLKLTAQDYGIVKIEANDSGGRLQFAKQTQIEPFALVQLVQSSPRQFKLVGDNQLRFSLPMEHPETRFQRIEDLINKLVE